jgi:DMSO/TMAO reductase YedYZ molybdopterin-dependent catalytic subunit
MARSRNHESTGHGIDRRHFLAGTAVGGLLTGALGDAGLEAEEPRPGEGRGFPGVRVLQKNPDNLEFPFPTLERFLVSNEQFYVRTHFEVPQIDVNTWKLRVEGAVEKPFEIGFDELLRLPSHTLTATLECAGNGRVFLKPPQIGLRWELGGVGNAEWTGVRLADVLERAGVRSDAVEVILEGADRGKLESPDPKTPGVIPFARSLPLKKARQPEVLLAYRMNSQQVPPAHGFPVRAVIPGWYGMASIKWLQRLIVTTRPFQGFFQTFTYTTWERQASVPTLVPVTEMQVKSQIARPALHEVVRAGEKYRVFGAAWAGEPEVTQVEVSTDGGGSWTKARLLDPAVRFAWRLWEYDWQVPDRPGRRVLMARATDSRGRVQPMQRNDDLRDSMISHVLPIEVEVR